MLAAFKGVYAVFAVTNYWEKMDMELEIEQGKNLADAALVYLCLTRQYLGNRRPTFHLEFPFECHRVYARPSCSFSDRLTDMSIPVTNGALLNVHHFDSKAKVEAYIRTTALPATYMLPGFYMSNFPNGNLKQSPPNNDWTLAMPVPVTAQVPLFATIEDAGKFVKGILNNREKTLGKRVLAATKYYSFQEMLDAFKAAFPEAGKTAQYFEAPHDVYKGFLTSAGLPEFAAQELLENMRLLNEGGYYGDESLEWSHSVSLIAWFQMFNDVWLTLQSSSWMRS